MSNYKPIVIPFEASLASTNKVTENSASNTVNAYDDYMEEVRKSDRVILAKYSR